MPDEHVLGAAGPSRERCRSESRRRSASSASDGDQPVDKREDPALAWYIDHLDEHISATIRQRRGREKIISIPWKEDIPEWLDWTLDEYSCFFAALARHSRLRPDLISHDCGRSESDVLFYLDTLEQGLAQQHYRSVESGADGSRNDRRLLKRKRKHLYLEGLAPAAREVSEEWIAKEEKLASMVDGLVKQRDLVKEEQDTAKRRRKEQRAVKRETKAVADPAERRRLKAEKFSELEKTWAQEDWERSLNATKLLQRDKLSRPRHEERKKRVRDGIGNDATGDFSREQTIDMAVGEDTVTSADGKSQPASRITSRHAKIAIDNAALKALLAIDRADRTPEQRAELYKLKHRKRTRDRTRRALLVGQGMTDEEIEAKGGLDAAYLATIGKTVDDETIGAPHPLPNIASVSLPTPPDDDTPQTREVRESTTFTATTMSEDSTATRDLRRLMSDRLMTTNSLDVINFRRLAQMAGESSMPMSTVKDAHALLLNHLNGLVLRTVLIGESEARQIGDAELEIDATHAQKAMLLPSEADSMPARHRHGETLPSDREKESFGIDSDDEKHEATDDENHGLDAALDTLDAAMDSLTRAQLDQWAGDDAEEVADEEGRAKLRAARADVGKARRHRHALQQRSVRFTSIYYRRGLGQRRNRNGVKSSALVEDSDDTETLLSVSSD